jgi:TolB-like protein/Flp pilus assembly protein TadD
VLPLDNYSGDPDQEYFCDGMTDLLISNLSQISSLSVISRTSVMQYKNNKKPIKEIARELGVDAIVEGSVLKSGNRVRVTAQLIDAAKDKHLWANNYEQEMTDILILQSAVAQAISQEIGAQLTPQEKSRLANVQTINPEAYEAYLKGRFQQNKMGSGLEYFQEAIRLQPNFAQAYAGLADAYNGITFSRRSEYFQKAKSAVQKALAIDSTLSEGYSALGFINFMTEGDWNNAEKNLRKALQLNPNNIEALQRYSIYLTAMARHTEAIATIRKAARLDPLIPGTQALVSLHYAYARDYDTALTEITKTIELHPDFAGGYYFRGFVYAFKRMYPEALASLQKAVELDASGEVMYLSGMGWVYALAGKRDEAIKILNKFQTPLKKEMVNSQDLALIYIGLGDFDKAFEYLNESAEETSSGSILLLKVAPWLDPLRSDPRFKELLKKVKLDK